MSKVDDTELSFIRQISAAHLRGDKRYAEWLSVKFHEYCMSKKDLTEPQ